MTGVFNKMDTINNTFRTALLLAITAGVGYGGFLGYTYLIKPARELEAAHEKYKLVSVKLQESAKELEASKAELATSRAAVQMKQQQIVEHKAEIQTQKIEIVSLEKKNSRLSTSLRLVKVDRRMAYLTVVRAQKDPETGVPTMRVLYTEVDKADKAIGKSVYFDLKGKLLHVDTWLAKFEEKYIEQAELARGSTLCIIRGIKGDQDLKTISIDEGVPVDGKGDQRPVAYRSMGDQTPLEKKIWGDFWSVANDSAKQKEMGIRAVHGQINYLQVVEGTTYQLDLRASDGATIKKIDNPPKVALPKTAGT